jgi:hypothetical protein
MQKLASESRLRRPPTIARATPKTTFGCSRLAQRRESEFPWEINDSHPDSAREDTKPKGFPT